MSDITHYDVKFDPDTQTWRVEKAGATRATAVCEDKDDAIVRATDLALNSRPSEVTVYDLDGRVEKSRYDNSNTAPRGAL